MRLDGQEPAQKPHVDPEIEKCKDDPEMLHGRIPWYTFDPMSTYPLALKFVRAQFFDPIFEGNFGGLLVLKMGHAAYRRKAPDV